MDQTAVVTDSFGNTAYVTDPNQNFNAVPWLKPQPVATEGGLLAVSLNGDTVTLRNPRCVLARVRGSHRPDTSSAVGPTVTVFSLAFSVAISSTTRVIRDITRWVCPHCSTEKGECM
jgi:hypothetical protein